MKKHYATYELSKLARKSGFDEECFQVYENENKLRHLGSEFNNSELAIEGYSHWITAPELTHLQQWVWETFKVWVFANQEPQSKQNQINNQVDFNYSIKKLGADISFDTNSFDCPYKALECGLLEFLKSKENAKS